MQIFLHFFTERNRNSVITEEPQTIRMVYAYILRHTLYVEGEGFLVIKPECLTRQTVKKYKKICICAAVRERIFGGNPHLKWNGR